MKTRVIFDIETSGFPIENFDEAQYEYLMKFVDEEETEERRERERAKVIERLNLYPLTAQVVAIGMLNVDSSQGVVLYQSDEIEPWEIEIEKILNIYASEDSRKDKVKVKFIPGTEREIIEKFWEYISKFEIFITFNGRGFDCPFLMLRSAILGIKPSRDLMEYNRLRREPHIDLLDEFTFFGMLRKFSLDFYCKVFGIESPKSHGITGHDINQLFNEKRFRDIAKYCMYDLIAEAELFFRWEQFLNPRNITNEKGL
jgi:DNA polymerase elongation subunit (family B)